MEMPGLPGKRRRTLSMPVSSIICEKVCFWRHCPFLYPLTPYHRNRRSIYRDHGPSIFLDPRIIVRTALFKSSQHLTHDQRITLKRHPLCSRSYLGMKVLGWLKYKMEQLYMFIIINTARVPTILPSAAMVAFSSSSLATVHAKVPPSPSLSSSSSPSDSLFFPTSWSAFSEPSHHHPLP